MKLKIKSFFFSLIFVLATLISCQKETPEVVEQLDVQLDIPVSVEVPIDSRILDLAVIDGKSPIQGDQLLLQSNDGRWWPCEIKEISTSEISVLLQKGVVQGEYRVYVKRVLFRSVIFSL